MNWEQLLYVSCVSVAVLGFAWLLVKTPKKRRSNAQYRDEPKARMTLVKPSGKDAA